MVVRWGEQLVRQRRSDAAQSGTAIASQPCMSDTAAPSRSKAARKPAPARSKPAVKAVAAQAALTLSSKNYSSWSLRGWLLAKFSGLEFDEIVVSPEDEIEVVLERDFSVTKPFSL